MTPLLELLSEILANNSRSSAYNPVHNGMEKSEPMISTVTENVDLSARLNGKTEDLKPFDVGPSIPLASIPLGKNEEKPKYPKETPATMYETLTEFERSLARFGDKVGLIASLEISGKMPPEEAYLQIKELYKELKALRKAEKDSWLIN
jgi:hypothetical protein